MHMQPRASTGSAKDRQAIDGLKDFAKRVLGGYERPNAVVTTGSSAVLLRAAKNAHTLRSALDGLSRGNVVALVPELSGGEYCEQVRTQLDTLTDARSKNKGQTEGLLALPTSGSTGRPKLVALPMSGIQRFIRWGIQHFTLDPHSTSLSLSPWNFDVSLLDTWAVLASGGSVICADPQRLHEPNYIMRLLCGYNISFLQAVPSTLDVLVHAATGSNESFPSVRDVIVTGGVAGVTTRRAAAVLFPRARFHNVYGSTEVNDCLLHTAPPARFASVATLPLGTPIADCDVRIDVEGEALLLADCPDGTEGELLVRTPWMAAGYIDGGRITPLIDSKLGLGDLYRMKDRVLIAEGQVIYLGRSDRTVKIRGQRINLDEIERLASATGVVRAACAWLSTSDAGEELHLAYTTAEGVMPGSGLQVRLALSARLPPYAIPNRLHAFGATFPLNGNGKPHLEQIKTQAEGQQS